MWPIASWFDAHSIIKVLFFLFYFGRGFSEVGAGFVFNSISPIMPFLQLMATEDGYLKRALQS